MSDINIKFIPKLDNNRLRNGDIIVVGSTSNITGAERHIYMVISGTLNDSTMCHIVDIEEGTILCNKHFGRDLKELCKYMSSLYNEKDNTVYLYRNNNYEMSIDFVVDGNTIDLLKFLDKQESK